MSRAVAIGQLSRFVGVGVVATLVHVVTAVLAANLFGLPMQAANSAGFAAAVMLSYFGHGKITFGARLSHGFHGPRFIAVSASGWAISSALTELIAIRLGAPLFLAMGAIALAVPSVTFVICKLWVFSERQLAEP
ncbi:GtrA family protein [Roseovarius sp. S4756]|uniref:GtrA family protein n=1 Tax=Roseovarius maritimus TaxID=3342637 RepID=UPI00372A88A1